MTIYFLSGLGADERAFKNIRVPAGYEMRHIPLEPLDGQETFEAYCRKLAAHIDSSKPFILAGLSFGGMAAIEISKFMKPEKLILISTIVTRNEIPRLYRMAGKLKIERFLPAALIPVSLPFLYWFFSPADKAARELIASFLEQSDPAYLRWAFGHISRWQNENILTPHIRIHGSRDKVFPIKLIHAGHVIKGSGHLSVLTDAEEINQILRKELEAKL